MQRDQLPILHAMGVFAVLAIVGLFLLPVNSIGQETGGILIVGHEGVFVHIDGVFVGITDASSEGLFIDGVTSGTHQLELTKDDLGTRLVAVDVKTDEITTVDIENLKKGTGDKQLSADKGTGVVIIRSEPQECNIWFVEKSVSKKHANLKFDRVPAGEHELEARVGEQLLSCVVPVIKDGLTTVAISFKKKTIDVIPQRSRVLVSEILPGGQSEEIGVRKNDIIVSYAGTDVTTNRELLGAVKKAKETTDTQVELTVIRGGKLITFKLWPGTVGVIIKTVMME